MTPDLDAVDQDQRLVEVGPAQEERGLLARPAIVGKLDACPAAQKIRDAARLKALDLITVDYGHRGKGFIGRLCSASSGYDYRSKLGRRAVCR